MKNSEISRFGKIKQIYELMRPRKPQERGANINPQIKRIL